MYLNPSLFTSSTEVVQKYFTGSTVHTGGESKGSTFPTLSIAGAEIGAEARIRAVKRPGSRWEAMQGIVSQGDS